LDQISNLNARGHIRDPLEEVAHSHSEVGVIALIDFVDERVVVLWLEDGAVGDPRRHFLLLCTCMLQSESLDEGRLTEVSTKTKTKTRIRDHLLVEGSRSDTQRGTQRIKIKVPNLGTSRLIIITNLLQMRGKWLHCDRLRVRHLIRFFVVGVERRESELS
jgi:hypothetical protein